MSTTLDSPLIHRQPTTARVRRRRFAATICAVLAIVALLASCASEEATDQNRARQRDATHTPVIAQVQATLAAKPFAATPTPYIMPTPVPIIAILTLTIGIGPDNTPQQQVQSFSAGTNSVYIAAQIRYLRKGEVISASWRTPNNQELASSQMTVAADADSQWVAFPLKTQLQPGTYAVYILADGNLLNSLVFTVN